MTFEEVNDIIFKRVFLCRDGFLACHEKLADLPIGYGFLHALSVVDSKVCENGVKGLRRSSNWSMMLPLQDLSMEVGFPRLASNIKEIVYFYHLLGQSGFKRKLPSNFFGDMSSNFGAREI